MEFSEALKIVTSKIKSDKELRYGYQANIAMAQIDSEYNYKRKTGKKYLNSKDKHLIANNAADNFLNLWCS